MPPLSTDNDFLFLLTHTLLNLCSRGPSDLLRPRGQNNKKEATLNPCGIYYPHQKQSDQQWTRSVEKNCNFQYSHIDVPTGTDFLFPCSSLPKFDLCDDVKVTPPYMAGVA